MLGRFPPCSAALTQAIHRILPKRSRQPNTAFGALCDRSFDRHQLALADIGCRHAPQVTMAHFAPPPLHRC